MSDHALWVAAARQARRHAHCPYSGYAVGAAVAAADGSLSSGCNVENASYGLTLCAERVALTGAVATGRRAFVGLAVVTADGAPPCGACLQVMAEFLPADAPVVLATPDGDDAGPWPVVTLADLLPRRFSLRPGGAGGEAGAGG